MVVWLLIVISLFSLTTLAQDSEENHPQFRPQITTSPKLYPILYGDWGYVDRSGQIRIEPQYDLAFGFRCGLALVVQDSRFGYIDQEGNVVVPTQYAEAWHFRDGVARTETDNGKWSYINKNGTQLFARTFEKGDAGDFSNGLAAFREDSLWGYIDKKGEYRIRPAYRSAGYFSQNLAPVEFAGCTGPGCYGYISRDGKVVIEPRFLDADSFSNGLAAVKITTRGGPCWGYIGLGGSLRITPQFSMAFEFSEGLAAVVSMEEGTMGKWGYINRQGEWGIPPRYQSAREFRGGIAVVAIKGKYALIRKDGTYLWPPTPNRYVNP